MNDQSKVSNWCVVSMASIPLVMTLGNSMLIPVLPIFEKKVGISSFQTSMIITSYSIASIFLIPIAGYLSDRFGRKMVILPSLVFSLIGGLIAGYASWKMNDPFLWIIIGRVLQGIGAAGAAPIILPLVGDLYKDDDEKTSSCLGIIETSNTFGKVLSPILGAAFAAFLWFLPFFSISFFSLISILLVIFFIKVPKKKDAPVELKEFIKKTKGIFKEHGKWICTVFTIGAYVMLVLFGILFYLSDSFEKIHHLYGVKKGFVLAIPLLALCVASYISGKNIKGNLKRMKGIMLGCLALLTLCVPFVGFLREQLVFLLCLTGLIGIAIGALLPTLDALITENIEKEERGTISSLYSSSRFIGVAAGPPLVSLVMKNGLNVSFIGAGLFAVIIIILVLFWVHTEEKTNPQQAGGSS
ncbi:MFS transporter [Rossellomorea marisflavi]|uniref:MFS transporter n=1 Tax=Rossellomorea marisflavi TaxID=189381 RepID=A0A0J5SIZ7_9BACI|nr:MFS transporter [Rossellomorea marisflavi]KMK97175.1 MFS transporter [Rossellomorea marisflavi]KML06750.1 MFS transporter [Rossellomorea marisflavi]KZE45197.1 MFS transporter [Rossellomorea marisflavi]USK94279.1 MFS transporter [Rossellomorea marisflavi]